MTAAPPVTLDPNLSHTRGETDTPLLETTIGDSFDATAERFGERDALVDVTQGRRWTYAELRADVDRLARALLAVGVGTGDRVGIWAPNCSEWTLVQYATAKIGAILVNINPAYRSHELQYVLGQAGISTLVAAESFKSSNYRQMVDEVRDEVDGLERVVYIGTSDWADLVARADEVAPEELARVQAGLSNTDPINIQYTSGTTGFPKGATLSHRNILNNGYFVARLQGFQPGDRLCVPVPQAVRAPPPAERRGATSTPCFRPPWRSLRPPRRRPCRPPSRPPSCRCRPGPSWSWRPCRPRWPQRGPRRP